MDLTKQKCVPCEGGTKPLDKKGIETYLLMLKTPWEVVDEKGNPSMGSGGILRIRKEFKFKDFKESMVFVNKVARIAEEEGHHPDITVSYNKVQIELTTHAIGGLSTNDFIEASKIEILLSS